MKILTRSLFTALLVLPNLWAYSQCPTVTETITDESCTGACDGQIQIDITAGTGPYTVEWFDGTGTSLGVIGGVVSTETLTGLCAGNYSVDVSNAGGGTTQVWFEDFESGLNGWTLNVPTGVNGADNNFWQIDDDESGMPAGQCGTAGTGNESMHITSVFNPTGGAAYDAGGLCGLLFCPETNMRAESPNISTVGFTSLTLTFDFIGNGDALNDNASLWYNDGGGWTLLDPSLKSNMCALQGEWTAYSINLPASCENIANLQIGFNWTNNDDGIGSDPSFAVNDIEIVSATGGGCTTSEAYVVGSGGPCACPITITETITDESCPTLCDGSIVIDIANGTGPYDVEWFDGGGASLGTVTGVVATDSITGLCPGNYSVEVTEAGGGGGGGPATVWTEGFDSGINGWTLNVPTGVNGADNNFFEIDDDESGMPAGQCGAAGMGSPSLHVTSVFFPGGGAAYDAGGLCGLLFCPETNMRAESPAISTIGFTGLTLNFDFIGNGDGLNDNASLWYNDGGGWTQLDPSLKSNMCALQGEWTAYSIALPASCDNIANLQIGFNWTNNDDGVGTDPSFAVHDIEIVSTTSGGGGSGCTQTAAFVVNPGVDPVITSEASTDITNCAAPDGTITITANGDNYELFTSGGASVATNATGSFTGLAAGDYYVEVGLNGCMVTSSTFTINNASAPAAPAAGLDATYCVGDAMADLTATAGAGGTLNWYSDAGLTTNIGTGATLSPGTTQGTTIYYVTETVAGCESAASTVTITINVCCDLSVSTTVTDETCDGDNDGSVDVTLTGSATYNVLVDGVPVAFGIVPPLTQTLPGLADGTYSIQVVDAADPSCDTTFNITINPGTVITIDSEAATDVTDCVTPDGTFTVTSTGGTSYELYTSVGGLVTTNATGNFTGLNAGDYYVIATDGACSAQSSTLTIANPSAPAAPVAGTDASYCVGDPMADLTATAGAGGTLNWYDDAGLTNNIGTGATITPGTNVGITIYYVTETVAGCESAASSVTITINAIPAAPTAGTDATYCLGDALADMTANGTGGTINWYDDAGLTNNIGTGTTQTPASTVGTTIYYVTETVGVCTSTASQVTITINDVPTINSEIATDLTDCVTPDGSITVTSTGTDYELFTSAGVSVGTNTTGVFTGLGAGDYYVVVSNGNCTTQGTTLTVIDQTTTSTNTVNAQVCTGSTYTFADGSQQVINSATSYVSTLTNSVGCDSIVTENITPVQSTTTVIDTTICEGDNYTSVGDAANFVNVLADFQHTSTLTASNGCDSIIVENVTVIPSPTIDLGNDFNGCFGESITLTATTNSGNPTWSTGDTTSNITFIADTDTFFVATVTGTCGTATDTIFITVLQAPDIDAGPDVTIPLGGTTTLTATSATSPISYVWDPSTGLSCTACDETTAGPLGTTQYIVTGTDENGCVGYDTVLVTIDGEISVYIPNIFSPNNDGQNDAFKVYGPAWSTYKLEIYDRWGSMIWNSEDPNTPWDGKHKNGDECPQSVFVYKFWGTSIVGQSVERAGNVMLTR